VCAAAGITPGTNCASAPNTCGQATYGFWTCQGTCTASGPPSQPASLPYPCAE
jgi:hypothetical protein